MPTIRQLLAAVAIVLGGCASAPSSPPSRDVLAPTGTLRVAFLAGPLYATKDPATGEFKGVAVDLGRSLSAKLGVPMQAVTYSNPTGILAGAKAGEWDVALMGVSAERAAAVDFSSPYMEVEQGYLVRAGVPVATAADVDRGGLRVGVIESAGVDALLSRTLKNATIVRAKSPGELQALFVAGNADVIAATKVLLFGQLATQPGARVLDGRLLVEPIAMAVPKGRDPGAASALEQFVATAKDSGEVKGAIERAGLRGVTVAPPK